MKNRLLIAISLVGSAALPASAEPKLGAIFSDHMVIQREQPLPVWGSAAPGEEILVRFAGQEKKARTNHAGEWQVRLDPLEANAEARELEIVGEKSVSIKDVLVGDVWLCSGQSNMDFPLYKTGDKSEIAKADYPRIRQFHVRAASVNAPQQWVDGAWDVCTPQTALRFTAVGYYFGRDLHLSQKIPIGLINSSVGGTGARLWLPTAALQASPVLSPLLDEDLKLKIMFCTKIRDTSPEAAAWLADVEAARAANQPLPLLPPLPKQDHYAGYLYNGMISPLTRFPIKGVLWYQGESNTTSFQAARQYRPLLTTLIDSWRTAWGIGEFPFYIVQLPSFGTTVAEHPWAQLRESQRLVSRAVPQSGLVVTVDLGEANTWHPLNKRDVGMRAALLARAKTYGEKITGTGPEYESMRVVGNEIVLTFAKHSGPLVANGGAPQHFTVAGADKKFFPATARIEGDTVIVSSAEVPAPVVVRYAWAGNPEGANLFNAAGLPASPFTTAPPD